MQSRVPDRLLIKSALAAQLLRMCKIMLRPSLYFGLALPPPAILCMASGEDHLGRSFGRVYVGEVN